ncbi:MAG: threonine--tRNA ligase [Rickettsiales bacterium]|nr:threonine--tRNA ligase [Pseudomonadota bacterium]MDG4546322.1 threonine--tRNA ligase [Rickettsiales bacterium]MDG4548465.1 threonine--tRNA ligase [Rickettsiales bacterium]
MVGQALEKSDITVTLPDGAKKSFSSGVTGMDVAMSIGEGLAKAAIAISINGELRDLTREIETDAQISIITGRDEDGLEIIRHDTAHIMAEAVQELYPETQVTIGPSIENGFYYDFAREKPFSTDDLEKIEAKMAEIVKRDEPIIRKVMKRDEAVEFFKKKGEKYKVELIEAIPQGEDVTFYQQGKFIDLCRGPHSPSTGKPKAFKLMKVAGAYWRGDSNNEMLHRIYGTAWATEKDLKQYLHRLEEAEKRDHRKLGREMELFHIQEEAQGQVFWHDKGWTLYRELENYIRRKIQKADYIEVKTPMLVDRSLWEKSGHWDKFRENMFISESEDKPLAIKPMNCPCHVQIFNQGLKSYRDLPLRMAEFGSCHRNEPSGALHGLMRVRAMVQDDAHIFCTEEQIVNETESFCDLLKEVYKELGFDEIAVKIATRPEVRAGTDETWNKAEKSLIDAVEEVGLQYEIAPGEGAFYGPKLEFHLKDTIGRSWQCGTLQMDFVLPERLDANYIGADGNKHRPVMLHRAILGSLERFIGILIEQYAGKFPLWLAPVQAVVVTVTSDADEYANELHDALKAVGVRSKIDISNEQISYKIRLYSTQKTPIIIAVGKREVETRSASIRRIGSKNQETLDFKELIDTIRQEAEPPA